MKQGFCPRCGKKDWFFYLGQMCSKCILDTPDVECGHIPIADLTDRRPFNVKLLDFKDYPWA